MPRSYFAQAYRWGDKEGHQYVVAFHADFDWIIARAEHECQDRGGKYGVAVYGIGEDHEPENKMLAYYPSLYGERFPCDYGRQRAAMEIGYRILEILDDGKMLMEDSAKPGYLKYKPVKLPKAAMKEFKKLYERYLTQAELSFAFGILHLNGDRTLAEMRQTDPDAEKVFTLFSEHYSETIQEIGLVDDMKVSDWLNLLSKKSLERIRSKQPKPPAEADPDPISALEATTEPDAPAT